MENERIERLSIVNCTPHAVRVLDEFNNTIFSLPGTKHPARVEQAYERLADFEVETADGVVRLQRVKASEPVTVDLPDPEPGVLIVVSSYVLLHNRDREDLIVPDQLVRDSEVRGFVRGCRQFMC